MTLNVSTQHAYILCNRPGNPYPFSQYAFFICTGFLIVGGLVFLLGACFVVADKQKVDDFYEGKAKIIFSIYN